MHLACLCWQFPVRDKRMSKIVIRMNAARHDISVNGEVIDLSSGTDFHGRYGVIKPNKDMDRASSQVIAALQRRGMFTKEGVA